MTLRAMPVFQTLAAAAVLLAAWECAAAPRVAVVLRDLAAEPTGFEVQLRSELQAAGFEVVMVQGPATSPQQLDAIAIEHQSVAAISFDRPAGSVTAQVWVTERMTGKTLLRAVRPEKVSPEAPSIIALRAVELLRASLLELNDDHPPRGTVPVPASVRAWVAPRPVKTEREAEGHGPRWAVAIGPALLGSPGGMETGIAPSLGLLWRPDARWTGELRWEGPFLGTIESQIGTASISQEFLTFRARHEPWAGQWPFSPWVALGVGGHHLGSHGSADAPYTGRTGGGYTLIALAGIGARLPISRGFSLVPEFDVLIAANRPVVRFSDRSSAHAGRPWLSGTISLELAW